MNEGHIRFHPFDPDSGLIPEIAEFGPRIERSGGSGIILIAVPAIETPSWCARAAAALVTTWSSQGARILLADASLVQPVLHEVFDLPNSEGLADVMMKGAQLRTVGRQVGSPKFLFIAAGTPTGDVADVMHSGRWDIVLEALREAKVHLVMYAPADLPGLDALLRRDPAVLLLGGDPEVAAEVIGALGLYESVGLRPPVRDGILGDAVVPSEQFGVLEPVIGFSEVPTHGTDSTKTARKQSYLRRVPPWRIAVPLGLLALTVWAGARVVGGGATESLEVLEERTERPVSVVAPLPEIPQASERPQAYSLSLAAFEDESVATLRAENLAGRRTDLLFTTVPVQVSGRVFHRILAGPATDSVAAEELRTSLGESLSDEDSSVWIVRATSLAFALGDYESKGGGGP